MTFLRVSTSLLLLSAYVPYVHSNTTTLAPCPDQEHSCEDDHNTCLHQRFWCDGTIQCPNEKDENQDICSTATGFFRRHKATMEQTNKVKFNFTDCFFDSTSFPLACYCTYGVGVNCSNISLTSVPTAIQPADVLKKLILSHNQITTLASGVFSQYSYLSLLDISGNGLRVIDSGSFNGLLHLKHLYLENNDLTELQIGTFAEVPSLRGLFLGSNRLGDWVPEIFAGNHSIMWLQLSNNRIQLKQPNMFRYFVNIQPTALELDGNMITEITRDIFKPIGNFSLLSLGHNQISNIAEDAFRHLTLEEIRLSYNRIHFFPPRLFAGQTFLRDVDLSYNPARYFSVDFFTGLHSLTQLNLTGLNIQNITKKMFDDPTINMLHIQFEKFFYCAYTPRVKDCSPKTDGISTAKHLLDSVYLKIFGWIIGLLACVMNGFVLGARSYLWKGSSHLSKLHSMCISTLAISDLLMGIYMLIISIMDSIYKDNYNANSHHWVHSNVCRFSGVISVISSEVSTLLLVFMAIERYNRLIWTPMSRSTCADLRKTTGCLFGCWLVGITIALLPLFAQLDTDEVQVFYGQNGVCLPLFIHDPYLKGWWISTLIFVITPILAMIIISFCYASIFLHVQQSRQASERTKADKSHLRKVLAITLSNNVSWVAIIITKILALCMVVIPGETYAWMAVFALPVNCCLNPIIYTMMTPEFRSMVRTCFSRRSRYSAEASALKQIVSYTAGMNGLSRGSTHRILPRRCSSGTSVTGSTHCWSSHQNSVVTFSRQSSMQTVRINSHYHRGSRRRSTSAYSFPVSLSVAVKPDRNTEEIDEDEGIALTTSDPSTSPPKWDC